MELYDYFMINKDRQIHKNIHYFYVYERWFSPFRGKPLIMFEIGTGGGGSARMWGHYFGPLARIVTLDINPDCKRFEDKQVKVRIGDQSDRAFLAEVIDEFGAPDIVLDDGSHMMDHIKTTFRFMYPRTARNGIYMVEALHTSYYSEYGGGVRKPGTFIELSKDLIDELNADWTRGDLPPTLFSTQTLSIQFYDSMIVFERGSYVDKNSVVTGSHKVEKQIQETMIQKNILVSP